MSNNPRQKLSFFEKAAYSGGDAAANFVFQTMILYQLNFYTDVFGLTASAAAAILLAPRLWDAFSIRLWAFWRTVPGRGGASSGPGCSGPRRLGLS